MSKELEQQHWLELARKGDREAFRRLVEDNSRRLYCLAWRIVGNEQLAEDVVQESFIKAYQQIDRFDGRSKISTWLYRITSNTAIDMKRKMNRQQTVAIDELTSDYEPVDYNSSIEDNQQSQSIGLATKKAMEELTVQERTAFTLRHHDGRTIDEISHILQVTENSVKQAIFRSIKKLRATLTPLMSELR